MGHHFKRGAFDRRAHRAPNHTDARDGTTTGEHIMADALYVSHVTLDMLGTLHRRATLPAGGTIDMGVHGSIAAFYRLAPDRELPLPVDYIVAATGG
jgi:hypothetical protein